MKDEFDNFKDLAKYLGGTDRYGDSMKSIMESMQSISQIIGNDLAKHTAISDAMQGAMTSKIAMLAQESTAQIAAMKTMQDLATGGVANHLRLSDTLRDSLLRPYEQSQLAGLTSTGFAAQMIEQDSQMRDLLAPSRLQAMNESAAEILKQAAITRDIVQRSMLEVFEHSGRFAEQEKLAFRLMEPCKVFADFMELTSGLMTEYPDPATQAALRASILLSEKQLLYISDFATSTIALPLETVEMPLPIPLGFPYWQQHELLEDARTSHETNEKTLIHRSKPAQLAEQAHTICQLVYRCNEQEKLRTGQHIFKPTNRSVIANADLIWLEVNDQESLGHMVDAFYFILYEGAGTDNLRFHTKNGGPMDDAACAFLWDIKHLRTWLRHDTEHGSQSQQARSERDLREALQHLGITHIPTQEQHYRILHEHMLAEAEAFLTTLLNKLAK